MNIKIALNKNKNKKAVNTAFYQTMELEQTSRQLPISNINKIVNSYQIFDNEINSCTKYRLTITINTIATNVLINPITQIYDGDIEITGSTRLNAIKTINPEFTYNCGYDIFDNHFLRVNTFKKGTSLDSFIGTSLKNVSSIQDSVDNNLFEDNGWMYFLNAGKINNNRMFINKLPCEKIDLFPTREYFSFSPMIINEKPEDNWDYCVTYPYKNIIDHILVTDANGINGLPISDGVIGYANENGNYLQITTSYKNKLNQHDIISFKYTNSPIGKTYQIYNVGDINGLNKECTFILDIDKYSDLNDVDFLNSIKTKRIVKIVDGVESDYYIRELRKVPNFKFDTDEITIENIESKITGNTTQITSDNYQLAFSRNIFGDKIHQIQFIDDIDISLLSDNLGRPISELYLTIIKKGKTSDTLGHNNIFGNVTSGIDEAPYVNGYSNIRLINSNNTIEIPLEEDITINGSSNNNKFLCDIVEYNKSLVKEIVLDNVMHRFNTVQRERLDNVFEYHTINHTYTSFYDEDQKMYLEPRNEGYFYNPHYKIQIKNYSSIINQGELNTIVSCEDDIFTLGLNKDGNIINLNSYVGSESDIQYLILKISNSKNFLDFDRIRINKVDSNNNIIKTLTLNIRIRGDINKSILIPYNSIFFGAIEDINNNIYQFKRYYSDSIPSYGNDMNNGRILWRDILPEGIFDSESQFNNDIQFTNGRLYLNKAINLVVKRQDPFGLYGLKSRTFPSDLYGDNTTNDILINNRFSNQNSIC